MGVIEHFDKMPLGVKILFILIVLGIPSLISALLTYVFIPFGSVYEYILAQLLGLFALAMSFLQAHGLWHGKKFMEKLLIFMVIYSLVNIFVVPLIFPNFYNTILEFSINNSDSDFSDLEKQTIFKLSQVLFVFTFTIGVILNLIFIWYVRKRKDYFVN